MSVICKCFLEYDVTSKNYDIEVREPCFYTYDTEEAKEWINMKNNENKYKYIIEYIQISNLPIEQICAHVEKIKNTSDVKNYVPYYYDCYNVACEIPKINRHEKKNMENKIQTLLEDKKKDQEKKIQMSKEYSIIQDLKEKFGKIGIEKTDTEFEKIKENLYRKNICTKDKINEFFKNTIENKLHDENII